MGERKILLRVSPIFPHPYLYLSNHGKAALMTSLPGGIPGSDTVPPSVPGSASLQGDATWWQILPRITWVRVRECFGYAGEARGVTAQCRPLSLLSLRRTLWITVTYVSTPLFNICPLHCSQILFNLCMEFHHFIISKFP